MVLIVYQLILIKNYSIVFENNQACLLFIFQTYNYNLFFKCLECMSKSAVQCKFESTKKSFICFVNNLYVTKQKNFDLWNYIKCLWNSV